MTGAQRKKIEAALKELIAELVAREGRKVTATKIDETDRADAEDDQPLEEMLQTINSNRNANDAAVLNKARGALRRLQTAPSDFGVCTDCGDDIAFARMKAMPYAVLCIACQNKADPRGKSARKKLTDFQ